MRVCFDKWEITIDCCCCDYSPAYCNEGCEETDIDECDYCSPQYFVCALCLACFSY